MSHRSKRKKLEDIVAETKVDMNVMAALARQYNVPVNDIFCGYIWQPIRYEDNGTKLIVRGGCSLLNGQPCQWTERPVNDRYACPVYKAKFKD